MIMLRPSEAKGRPGDVDLLDEIAHNIAGRSLPARRTPQQPRLVGYQALPRVRGWLYHARPRLFPTRRPTTREEVADELTRPT